MDVITNQKFQKRIPKTNQRALYEPSHLWIKSFTILIKIQCRGSIFNLRLLNYYNLQNFFGYTKTIFPKLPGHTNVS